MPVVSAATAPPPRVFAALSEGRRRLHGGKRCLAAAYVCNLFLAAVLGSIVLVTIKTSLGASLAGDRMRAGFDSLWFNSFSSQATGVAATFRPSVTGIGAVFDALDSFLDGFDGLLKTGAATGVLPVAVLYWLLWLFFSGGILSLYAAPHERRRFAAEACRWLPGIAGVAALSVVFYWLVLAVVRPWFDAVVSSATRGSIDERVRFSAISLEYIVLWAMIWFGNMLFDYAKIALVTAQPARGISAPVRAIGTACAFVWRRPLATSGLYLSLGLIWIAGPLLYWAVVPGAGDSSTGAILGGFFLGQLFVISRIWTRCLFYASETAMYAAVGVGAGDRSAR
jgi:hypothetical protein